MSRIEKSATASTRPVMATTEGAGQSIDEGKGRIFPCEGCGADLHFNIDAQKLKCPYCGFEQEIEFSEDEVVVEQDFKSMLARLRERHDRGRALVEGQHEIRCSACGGHTVFSGSLTSNTCPFCDSPIQRDNVYDAQSRVSVDGVLPFRINHQTAQTNLKSWIQSRWFAPNEFLERGVKGRFNGVYLPFWTFDTMTFTRFSGARGEHYYVTVGSGKNKRRERRTRWYPTSGRFQRFFDDVLVLAVKKMKRGYIRELEPWPLEDCEPFNQEMLAGYLARAYEIELEDGFVAARQRVDEAIYAAVRERIGGDEQRIDWVKSKYNAVTFKHLLLPVWLMAYRFKNASYQVMVNAATGEVQGERPYSWIKISITAAACALAVGVVVLLSQN